MKIAVIHLYGSGSLVIPATEEDLQAFVQNLINSEPGTEFAVTIEEWEKEDVDALPEWDGW